MAIEIKDSLEEDYRDAVNELNKVSEMLNHLIFACLHFEVITGKKVGLTDEMINWHNKCNNL